MQNMFLKFSNFYFARRSDEELNQVLTRILFSIPVFGYLLFHSEIFLNFNTSKAVIFSFILFHTINTIWVIKKPGIYRIRRIAANIVDLILLSYFMGVYAIDALFLYPVYLWSIIGQGIRFGANYLLISVLSSTFLFSLATMLSPSWQPYHTLAISMIAGSVAISFLYTKSLRRVHILNNSLEKKVQERIQQLEYEYYHDVLTGLKNRYALEQDLKENHHFSTLIIIDIDGFRNINELYGMSMGNHILKKFGLALQRFYENKNFELYRLYGDIFALRGLSLSNDTNEYENYIQELLAFVENYSITIPVAEEPLKIDITIGLTLEKKDALAKAETALHYAKNNNKKFITYSKIIDSSKNIHELFQRKLEIKEAITNNNIIPVFQPIMDRKQTIVKYESLIRMRKLQNDKEELISPYFFLDIAIKTKQYEALTLIMIEKSFATIKDLGIDFALNLSFNDMANEHVMQKLKECIQKYEIGEKLTIEILESENIEDYEVIKHFIHEVKQLGVKIAIDDFGSGYSNFTKVFQLSPDFIKIDGSLIKNIDTDKTSYAFVKNIVQLARSLGIKTVAEFVSSKEIFEITYELGIDYFQGYYFAPPLKAETIQKEFLLPA